MARYMAICYRILAVLMLAAGAAGCGGGAPGALEGGDTITARAELLTLVQHDGWLEASVADPWKPGRTMASYALVHTLRAKNVEVPRGFTRIIVPLKRSIVFSSVHSNAIARQLNEAKSRIAGIADGTYLPQTNPLAPMVAAGKVRDIGSSLSPSIEAIIDLNPDAILLSPYENVSTAAVEKAGAPLVMMADYMEKTPLGRAEWLLLLGYLYGAPKRAESEYAAVVAAYDSIASAAASNTAQPAVFTEMLTSGVWYQPAGESYMARLIADAGGRYLWADTPGAGSLSLDEAAVIDRAADADIWLIKSFGPLSARALEGAVPRAASFKAFPAGVWVCDTKNTPLFDDLAFRPDRILSDFARIFSASGEETLYYKPIDIEQ